MMRACPRPQQKPNRNAAWRFMICWKTINSRSPSLMRQMGHINWCLASWNAALYFASPPRMTIPHRNFTCPCRPCAR
ncbi:UNVERIFIED_CONTAM: hypothetical protein GTU68_060257 [Idotea baltica]|nr:hypothetical protein [Idotea baltica]